MSARLNIGLIGSGFMGQAHADAYRRAAMFYPDLPKRPYLYALADQDQALAERHAVKLGAEKAAGKIISPARMAISVSRKAICVAVLRRLV